MNKYKDYITPTMLSETSGVGARFWFRVSADEQSTFGNCWEKKSLCKTANVLKYCAKNIYIYKYTDNCVCLFLANVEFPAEKRIEITFFFAMIFEVQSLL